MADLSADGDERDGTHFWIFCPGCTYAGKIGVPHNHPADVVVCPHCHEVVNVRPQHRILWRPAAANEFMRKQFPHVDWETIDRTPRPELRTLATTCAERPVAHEVGAAAANRPDDGQHADPAAAASDPGGSSSGSTAGAYRAQGGAAMGLATGPFVARATRRSGDPAMARACAVATIAAMLVTVVIALVQLSGQARIGRRGRAAEGAARAADEAPGRDAVANAPPSVNPPPPVVPPPPAAPPPQIVPPPEVLPPPPAVPPPAPDPVAPPKPVWSDLYERACERLRAADYAEAVSDLNEVLRLNPDFTDALVPRATAYFRLGRYQLALADIDEEIRRRPASYQPFVSRSVVHETMGQPVQAVADLEIALRLATAGSGKVNDAEAEELREHLMAIVQDLAKRSAPASAYARRSTWHEQDQDYAAAVIDMRQALSLDPMRQDYRERLKDLEVKRKFRPVPFPMRPRRPTVQRTRST